MSLAVADLQVVIIAAPDAPPPPAAESVDADQAVPTPALPEGLSVRQRGIGWCALDQQGQVVLFWDRLRLPAGSPFVYGWRWAPELLRLESVNVGNGTGVLISGAEDRFLRLIVRDEPGEGWLVGGRLPAEELRRLAASLLMTGERN